MSISSIHFISTVNGQVNEGMRNFATHTAKAFEKNYEMRYSGLKSIASIIKNSIHCDATVLFARANKMAYYLSRVVGMFSRNLWIVCVQKPEPEFERLVKKRPLKANYLTIVQKDLNDIILRPGYRKETLRVGINADKFSPADTEKQRLLKEKYGFNPDSLLVIHVGHCSCGRGLEDFAEIKGAERMVVSSGMFENAETVKILIESGVKVHKGYLENVEEVYQMADVYLFPTCSTEYVISIPLSVMEALSCGVPVVGYREFGNLAEISAEDNSVILINGKDELNSAVKQAAEKKQNKSYLKDPVTWDQVAADMLKKISAQ